MENASVFQSAYPGNAGTSPSPGFYDMSPEKGLAIRRLLEVSQTLIHARKMAEAVVRHVGRNMKPATPERGERTRRILFEEADQVFAAHVPEFADALVPLYHRYFTLEEIEAMVEFYSSTLGQKTLEVMPNLLKEVAQLTEHWARGLIPGFYKRALARLKAEGGDLNDCKL